MILDSEIVGLMAKLYAPAIGDFDFVEQPGSDAGLCWAVKHYPDNDVLIFRGSMTKEDWFRDVIAELGMPPQTGLTNLGYLPLGFELGMAAQPWITLLTGKPLIIGGHSLGAARAAIAAGLAKNDGKPPAHVVLCGCPRPGAATLATWLQDVDITSYRNGNDPVCDVPTAPPWSHIKLFAALNVPPMAGDNSVFRDHHIPLYETGVLAREGAKP